MREGDSRLASPQLEPVAEARPSAEPLLISSVDESAYLWVAEDLIQSTLAVWQRYYEAPLTRRDAIEMILAASRLVGALSRSSDL
jgi:hypothetical protein